MNNMGFFSFLMQLDKKVKGAFSDRKFFISHSVKSRWLKIKLSRRKVEQFCLPAVCGCQHLDGRAFAYLHIQVPRTRNRCVNRTGVFASSFV